MAKHLILAPIGGDPSSIFLGVREFQTERVILVAQQQHRRDAAQVKEDLERFRVPVTVEILREPLWEELFRVVREARTRSKGNVIIDAASGTNLLNCAATSAAFVNGLRAYSVGDKGEVLLLPVLKFNYYALLSERKMRLLHLLKEKAESSLEELSRKAKMSLSLASYHVNGNQKSEGLRQLGLVETREKSGRVHLKLTTLGSLLLNGYV